MMKKKKIIFLCLMAVVCILSFSVSNQEVESSENKKRLIMVPHEDDEILMAGGVIKSSVESNIPVKVLIATNGDYEGEESGKERIMESIKALNNLGVPTKDIIFLGFADTGNGGGISKDSFLHKLYTAEDDTLFFSRFGNDETYGIPAIKEDFHFEKYKTHAKYTRKNFIADLVSVIDEYRPTDIYVTSRFDMHYDHAYLNLFSTEAINAIRKKDSTYQPHAHEGIVHSSESHDTWPKRQGENKEILSFSMPEGLEDLTPLVWQQREIFEVPDSMQRLPISENLKDQTLRMYESQYEEYIGAFVKKDEFFWKRAYTNIVSIQSVDASSESKNSDLSFDQSAKKAIDGIRDGYATGLPFESKRFPHTEWVTTGEKEGAWLNIIFDNSVDITTIALYDRPNPNDQIIKGHILFDDGTIQKFNRLPNDGKPLSLEVNKEDVKSVKLVVDEVSATTTNTGLSEIEFYNF